MTEEFDAHEERLERIDRAFGFVPLSLYDEVTKLAEYAVGELITERDVSLAELERLRLEVEILEIGDMTATSAQWEGAYKGALAEIERLREVEEAARRVGEAHRKIIAGVTPNHPEATFHDEEARDAAWSEWHASCRALREALRSPAEEEGPP